MEVDQIQFKFPRITDIGNNRKLTQKMDEEEDEGTQLKRNNSLIGIGPFYNWPSSRIVRVSRASGGKDRHSKVLTSKGLRDRRVRLSVNTAIQFYDLQDRLGYDQPSKAVEWLLKAAATSIAELPPMTTPFPETPKTEEEKRSSNGCFDEADPNETSETSKGSGPRSENRFKARERAKGRVAEKDKEKETCPLLNNISQTTSFTELLSSSNPMDSYFSSSGIRNLSSSNQMFSMPEQQQHQYFSFVPDQDHQSLSNNGNNLDFTMSSSSNNSNNNNSKNSSSSLGLDGFNRGTLQSNSSSSSSLFPHIQRYHSSPPPNFYNTAPVAVENHAQFMSGLDGRLHLCYGDATQGNNTTGRHSGTGKGKN